MSNATIADSAHEATKKLAYECWERRGRPFGSPEMDWSAAQKALSSPPADNQQAFSLCSLRLEADECASR